MSIRNLSRYDEEIASDNKAIEIKRDLDDHDVWYHRGKALEKL